MSATILPSQAPRLPKFGCKKIARVGLGHAERDDRRRCRLGPGLGAGLGGGGGAARGAAESKLRPRTAPGPAEAPGGREAAAICEEVPRAAGGEGPPWRQFLARFTKKSWIRHHASCGRCLKKAFLGTPSGSQVPPP